MTSFQQTWTKFGTWHLSTLLMVRTWFLQRLLDTMDCMTPQPWIRAPYVWWYHNIRQPICYRLPGCELLVLTYIQPWGSRPWRYCSADLTSPQSTMCSIRDLMNVWWQTVSVSQTTTRWRLALVTATFIRRSSARKPISPKHIRKKTQRDQNKRD